MDTLKDALALNELWDSGAAPWRLWERDGAPHAVAAAAAGAGPRELARSPLVAS